MAQNGNTTPRVENQEEDRPEDMPAIPGGLPLGGNQPGGGLPLGVNQPH